MRRGSKRRLMLAVLRIAAQKTQQQLADELYVDRNVVSRAENGSPISTDLVVKWVTACGGSKLIDWLIEHLRALKHLHDAWDGTDHRAYA